MSLEEMLAGWTGPSSDTEKEKQERTERMIREAVQSHLGFNGCDLSIYVKGSYANNTNVRADSDVDIAVQCRDVVYWEEAVDGAHPLSTPYKGVWTPAKFRTELGAALKAKFPNQVDDSGSIAFTIHSSGARMDADVVPCFNYKYYFTSGNYREGSRVFRKDGTSFENYPQQQLEHGGAKNQRTSTIYKKAVRIVKRLENAMLTAHVHGEVTSYFMECLVFNCPDDVCMRPSWTERIRGIIVHIWNGLEGEEPSVEGQRWLESNEVKFLFHPNQKWTRADGRAFAKAMWNHLGFKS